MRTPILSLSFHTLLIPSVLSATRVHGCSLTSAVSVTLPICNGYSPSGNVVLFSASSSCEQAESNSAAIKPITVNVLYLFILSIIYSFYASQGRVTDPSPPVPVFHLGLSDTCTSRP